MIIQIVRYASPLSREEVQNLYESRSDKYRAIPGLLQKHYVRFQESGEYGGVYVWESEQALQEFRDSQLSGSITSAYKVEGEPTVEIAEVMLTLRPELIGTPA